MKKPTNLSTFATSPLKRLSFFMLIVCSLFSAQLTGSTNNNINLDLELTAYDADCGNANNGAVTSLVSGGVPPYSYLWSNGETTAGIVDLAPGAYTLTVTDAALGTIEATATVGQEDSNISLQLNASYETCDGSCDGNVSVNASGGNGSHTYEWNTGDDFVVVYNACAGLYTVTVTDEDGCSAVGSIELELSPEGIWLMTSGTDATCASSNDGTAHVSVMTGEAPYTIEWSDGQTGEDVTGLAPGTYTVTVTDANGCFNTDEVTIEAGTGSIDLQLNASYETCDGSCDGNVSVNASGGSGNYSYLWSNGETFVVVDDACAGVYSVTVTDLDNGCVATGSIELELSPEGVWLMTSSTDVTCNGGNDGTAHVSVMAGEAPYQIEWNTVPPQMGEDATGLSAGTYTVTAIDANGCSNSEQVVIEEPSAIEIVVNFVNDADCNVDNGSINIGVLGGNSPYSYAWSNGATTQDIENLGAGNYTVTVTDANGCTAVEGPITINETSDLLITLDNVVAATCGLDNGAINISVSGGTPGYTFAWSNGATTEDIENLSAGDYTVTVTDTAGCTAVMGPITVNGAPAIVITVDDVINATCGLDNGAINISVSGGTPGYTYAWSNGATTEDIDNLSAGDYTVTVTDAAGCTAVMGPITVNESPAIVITLDSVTDANCGENDGAINISVSGGTPGYSFSWSNGAMTEDIDNLSPGDYTVTVTDAAGCTAVMGPTSVGEEDCCDLPVVESVVIIEASCGNSDGSVIIQMVGNNTDYSFTWTPDSSSTNTATGIPAGIYSVVIATISEPTCPSITEVFTVGNRDFPDVNVVASTPASCGLTDGSVEMSEPGFMYLWCNGETVYNPTMLSAGMCAVQITDPSTGCTDFQTVIIEEGELTDEVVVNNYPDCGVANGSVTINISGGSGMYNYDWGNGNTTNMANNLSSGSYSVTVTDAASAQCGTVVDFVLIDNVPGATIVVTEPVSTTCVGSNNATVVYDITYETGFAQPATIEIVDMNDVPQTNGTLSPGTYCIIVTDANGCIAGRSCFDVIEPDQIDVDIAINDFCPSPSITIVEVIGGNGGYTFDWADLPGTDDPRDRTDLTPGLYSVTVTDVNGCSVVANNLPITAICDCPPILVESVVVIEATCGNSDGSACIEMVGDEAGYTYDWDTNEGTPNANGNCRTNLPVGVYTVIISDNDEPNCPSITETFTIGDGGFPLVTIASSTPATCQMANGSVEMSNQNYEYEWCNGETGYNPIALPAGACVVKITDPLTGCMDFQTVIIEEENPLVLTIGVNNNPDCGIANGSITATIGGGSGDYSYEWSNGSTTATIDNIPSGLYCVTVTDNGPAGCVVEGCIVLTDNVPGATIIVEEPISTTCIGTNDGTVVYDITYDGGFAQPATIEIICADGNTYDNGSLPPGTCCIIVTDANNCVAASECFDVLEPAQIDLDLAIHNTCDPTPGIEVVEVMGGTPGYTFDWADLPGNDNPEDRPDLETGSYSLTVTDSNGCSVAANDLMVIDTCACPPMIISSVIVIESGCGDSLGQATVNVVGADSNIYSYEWSQGVGTVVNNGATLTNIPAGTYAVTITNISQPECNIIEELSVGNEDGPEATHTSTPSLCGSNNGTVNFSNPAFEYTWSGGLPTGADQTGLEAGTYFVTITDPTDPDCYDVKTVVVEEVPSFTVSHVVNTLPDCNASNGSVTLMPSVAGNYTYSWGNSTADNLSSGVYSVTVTDNNSGCTAMTFFTLLDDVDNAMLAVEADAFISCPGTTDGTINYTIANAGNYSVEIQDLNGVPQTNGSLAPGNYCVIAIDVNGCVAGAECIEVKSPSQIDVDVAVFDEECGEPGEIQLVEVLGGIPGYTYDWSAPVTTTDSVALNLGAGPYTFTVTDMNGCVVSETVFVEDDPNALSLLISGDTSICSTPTLIAVDANGETYTWTNENGTIISNNPSVIIDTTGMFYVEVVNGNCVEMDSVLIVPDELEVQIADVTACFGDSEVLNPMGDTTLVYVWTPDDGSLDNPNAPNPTVMTNTSTEFMVTITDSLGVCETIVPVNYEVIDQIDLSIASDSTVFCSEQDVVLTVNSNATNFTWYDDPDFMNSVGNGSTLPDASPGSYGNSNTYYVIGSLSNCADTTSITISNEGIAFEIVGADEACEGETIVLSPEYPQGVNTNGASFTWTGTGVVDPLAEEAEVIASTSGSYSLDIENDYCSFSGSYDVSVSSFDAANITAIEDTIFLSETSQLNLSGGNDGWTYLWQDHPSFLTVLDIPNPEVQPEETTRYTVEITDDNDCVDERSVEVVVVQPDCEEPYIFFPNAFSPNGDGFNDVLYVRGQDLTEVFFAIYDRWGEKVFESNAQSVGWDGTFKGKELGSDVYGFYLRVRCGNGDEFYKQGNVTLFR